MSKSVPTKLTAARTRLIIDKPFLGALVLRLPIVEADPAWCYTTATDARKIYYNCDYIESLDVEQTQFILAHEALHCALSHFARRQYRDRKRWDLACDLAINPILIEEGLKSPPGALVEDGFIGMTAEEIYPSLDESCDDEPLDQHIYDSQMQKSASEQSGNDNTDKPPNHGDRKQKPSGNKNPQNEEGGTSENQANNSGAQQPPPLNQSERDSLGVQWQHRLVAAAQQAYQTGKLGSHMARMIDYFIQPQLPWRSLLAQYVSSIARDDYTYARPSTRRGDPALYPSLRSGQVNMVIVLDTSGSISDAELTDFLSEINAIKGQISARIVFHSCDVALAGDGPWLYEPWEEFRLPREFPGGGGTNFIPAFDWANNQLETPDLLVYFTDAQGEFPNHEPHYPVIWLVKGKASVPWGRRVQLN